MFVFVSCVGTPTLTKGHLSNPEGQVKTYTGPYDTSTGHERHTRSSDHVSFDLKLSSLVLCFTHRI